MSKNIKDQNNASIVLYSTTYKICRELPDGKGIELLTAICDKVFYDIEPELSDSWLKPIYDQQLLLITKAKDRHEAAVNNGKKGGAPRGNQNAKKDRDNDHDYSF